MSLQHPPMLAFQACLVVVKLPRTHVQQDTIVAGKQLWHLGTHPSYCIMFKCIAPILAVSYTASPRYLGYIQIIRSTIACLLLLDTSAGSICPPRSTRALPRLLVPQLGPKTGRVNRAELYVEEALCKLIKAEGYSGLIGRKKPKWMMMAQSDWLVPESRHRAVTLTKAITFWLLLPLQFTRSRHSAHWQ